MIYLASPYSHENPKTREERFEIICRVAGRLMREGHIIFCPISHTHPIAVRSELPKGWDFWQRMDIEQLNACSEIWVCRMEGWQESKGVTAEIIHMQKAGKPVKYIDPQPEDVLFLEEAIW